MRIAYAWQISPAEVRECTLEELDEMAALLQELHVRRQHDQITSA